MTHWSEADVDAILAQTGRVVDCACEACGALNAHCWDDCNMDSRTRQREPGCEDECVDVWHIPVAGAWEWQCGKCGTHWAEAGSPLTDPCYTHAED